MVRTVAHKARKRDRQVQVSGMGGGGSTRTRRELAAKETARQADRPTKLERVSRDLRDSLTDAAPINLHTRGIVDDALDPRPFSARFAWYLDNPPDLVGEIRRRKYALNHYKQRHPNTCNCDTRLAFKLVWHVVIMRAPLGTLLADLKLDRRLALRILENELLTIDFRLRRYQSARNDRSK